MSFLFELVLSGAIVYFVWMIHQYWKRAAKYDWAILDFKNFILAKGLKERGFDQEKPATKMPEKKSYIEKAEESVENALDYADSLVEESNKGKKKRKK